MVPQLRLPAGPGLAAGIPRGMLGIADKSHRLPRSAEAGFDFRTDADPFHIATEDVCQKIVPLMSPVEPDFVSEETTADPKTERWSCYHYRRN